MFAGEKSVLGLSVLAAVSALCAATPAAAHVHRHGAAGHHQPSAHHAHLAHHTALTHEISAHHHQRYAALHGAHVIQCVAFAKKDAGIAISGNARDWWGNAAGIYERGHNPEPGSVLSFRANGRMPLGHVAVVSGIEDSRTIVIEQAHWNSRGVTRDVLVRDVSDNNDWTAVRVQLSHGGAFGSIYATHGFIYPRPSRDMDAAGRDREDVRAPVLQRVSANMEIAEGPEPARALTFDAPSRDLQ